jgi:hypothetical protein
VLGRLFAIMGWGPIGLTNMRWTLPLSCVALFVVLAGVHFMVRMHRIPQWLIFAMTLLFTVIAVSPAGESPFYSPAQIYMNRALILLPLAASSAYLLTPGVRAATRR